MRSCALCLRCGFPPLFMYARPTPRLGCIAHADECLRAIDSARTYARYHSHVAVELQNKGGASIVCGSKNARTRWERVVNITHQHVYKSSQNCSETDEE